MKYIGLEKTSLVNGEGIRCVLWVSGCNHHCRNCQNPDTWDPDKGQEFDASALTKIFDRVEKDYCSGLTLSGGDPMLQAKECIELAKALSDYNIWCYTGWTLEEIEEGKAGEDAKELLRHIDVLVDGRFVKDLKTDTCKYRGSSNQKIIHLKKKKEGGIK